MAVAIQGSHLGEIIGNISQGGICKSQTRPTLRGGRTSSLKVERSLPKLITFNTRRPTRKLQLAKGIAYQPGQTKSRPVTKAATLVEREASTDSCEYNQMMQRQMKNPYEYHHELGMYYTPIQDHLIVGSQPQSPQDIKRLFFDEGVDVVLNLQQDHDIHYWGINIEPIRARCHELGIRHYRRPAKDFDPHSLRYELPRMVAVIEHYIARGKTVYVHCTAGLGRAPGAAIAYLFWFHNMDMHVAYNRLTSKRPCGPKKEAIRGATYDLAKNDPWKEPFEHLPDYAFTDVADWERQLIQERVRALY